MQNPIAVQSSEFSTSLSAEDQEEYESLQKVYLEKRVRTGADAELPANGMRLRRQQRQARINAPHYARLKKKLQLLMKRHNHVESFRLLSLLRDYETKQLGFLPYDLMQESGKQTTTDSEVVEVIEIDDSEDEGDGANFIDLEMLDGDGEDKDSSVSAGPNQNMHIDVKVEGQVEEERATNFSNMELPENDKGIVFSQFQSNVNVNVGLPAAKLKQHSKRLRQPIKKEAQEDPICGDDENHPYCHICRDGGNIVCCDECPKSYHPTCVPKGISRRSLDNDNNPWHCHLCLDQGLKPDTVLDKHSKTEVGTSKAGGKMASKVMDLTIAETGFGKNLIANKALKKARKVETLFKQVKKKKVGRPKKFISLKSESAQTSKLIHMVSPDGSKSGETDQEGRIACCTDAGNVSQDDSLCDSDHVDSIIESPLKCHDGFPGTFCSRLCCNDVATTDLSEPMEVMEKEDVKTYSDEFDGVEVKQSLPEWENESCAIPIKDNDQILFTLRDLDAAKLLAGLPNQDEYKINKKLERRTRNSLQLNYHMNVQSKRQMDVKNKRLLLLRKRVEAIEAMYMYCKPC